MGVIINDFQVEVEPPEPARDWSRDPVRVPAAETLGPDDVERIMRHFERRAARLIAD
jgi:hypothetical protein